ncbi:uncharacterized protein Z518_10408 [Rhinocladiella mackenziei CBS 650.93]|uniref:Ubiquitin-like domain-containing protein n=1 Tax=Rhinocladiella mackenziei CBS 650.93 TaxID=1442369 RepID=A0A0D2I3B9_9EURO|nr:uncharacterized protein Z518_10408 [Rhinocladiella mackenziei CBS 650.93]KIX00269.1 hypothetical protein Z518_10408 [Rhinocladiella mackenziei CBS 650.93]
MGCVVYLNSSVNADSPFPRSSSRHSHTHIDITHVRSPSRTPSPASQDDELHENGVQVSPAEISPQYSVIQPTQSQSGSSSLPGDFQVVFPNELPEGDGSDSASRVDPRERAQQYDSRSNSTRRQPSHRRQALREQTRSRPRELQETSPTESGDSTEEFLARRDLGSGMPRPQSYYGHNGYTHSSSSGSYAYPAVPPSNQVIPLQPQPMAVPYPPHYPHVAGGQPMPYAGFSGGYSHHAPSQVSSPYTSSPYGAPTIVNYGGPPPPGGYFTPQYAPQFGGQQYPPQYLQYPQQMPLPFVDYRMPMAPSPQPGSANASADKLEAEKKTDPEDMFKRFADLMKEERAQAELSKEAQAAEKAKIEAERAEQESRIREQALRQAEEKARQDALRAEEEKRIRDQALIQAAEKARAEAEAAAARAAEERRIREEAVLAAEAKARADAAALAERMAAEQRIREEARQEAIRAYEEKVRQAAEQAAREQQIRKEAAEAALKAAAEEAAAKAEKAAAEKKIADEAAAAAKSAAEKEAADAAAAAQEEAKKVKEEAEAKLKEAEEAAAKAKAEAEEAEKKAAAAAPPEKKPPVRFKDAIGRNYNFPWERCCRWRDMESLINQAFAHIDGLAEHVMNGRYDLIGPDKEIIMPGYWESTIEPDMQITMMLWPIPEPKKEEEVPAPSEIVDPDAILNLDEILNPKEKKKGVSPSPLRVYFPYLTPNSALGTTKKKKPGGLASWMLGGAPSRSGRSLKGEKKPDVAARSQHGATDQSACAVM